MKFAGLAPAISRCLKIMYVCIYLFIHSFIRY